MECIYCGQLANTHDHAPPKLLMTRPYPPNMITVPSCRACNQGASLDEEYFRILLAHVGTSPGLTSLMQPGGAVDRALSRATKLANRIDRALGVSDGGQPYIQPEVERVHRVLEKTVHGLYVSRYGRNPGPARFRAVGMYPYTVKEARPAWLFAAAYTERFRAKRWQILQQGVFAYAFVRHPCATASLLCLMAFHHDAWGAVETPVPSTGRRIGQSVQLQHA
ncbi:MAG TPA: hypothetical protein VF041_00510 [Gemmatimonadaceae bacterium]